MEHTRHRTKALSQTVQLASKTLPETSTQNLSNDLFWDPLPPLILRRPQPGRPDPRGTQEQGTSISPCRRIDDGDASVVEKVLPHSNRTWGWEAEATKILRRAWPPSHLFSNTKGIPKLNIANPQINLLRPSIINSGFEPKDPPFPSLVLQSRMISVPMTMRLPRTFMAPPSTSFPLSLWQFSKCSSAEAATNASLSKAKHGPCKAFMALTDSFPSRRAVSTNFNVVLTKRVVPWSRSVVEWTQPKKDDHNEKPFRIAR